MVKKKKHDPTTQIPGNTLGTNMGAAPNTEIATAQAQNAQKQPDQNVLEEIIVTSPANKEKSANVATENAAKLLNNTGKQHVHHEPGGIVMHCDDSDCEIDPSQSDGESAQHQLPVQSEEFVPESAASSSGFHRQNIETLRTMHPLRKDVVGPSDNICIDTGHSSVHGINSGQPSTSPWIANDGNFLEGKKPLNVDLILPKPTVLLTDNVLQLEEADYTPIHLGWGFSLLGFFVGRFPGKDAVHNLTKRWKFPSRVSFHPKGWIIFRFETEEQSKIILAGGTYSVFGLPLVLGPLPTDFRFDSSPSLKFQVWATLPNLPLELWNPSAISKIAATVGTPLKVAHETISKQYIAGPRVLIDVDASKEPPKSITLKLHNGNTFDQSILLDFYPFFCSRCRRAGHTASSCRASVFANPRPSVHPRAAPKLSTDQGEWQTVQRKNIRNGRSASRRGISRSKSRATSLRPNRSLSRPSKQQWRPVNHVTSAAAPLTHKNGAIPAHINNTHLHFDSHSSGPAQLDANPLELSNQFQTFDDLEQLEDATAAGIKAQKDKGKHVAEQRPKQADPRTVQTSYHQENSSKNQQNEGKSRAAPVSTILPPEDVAPTRKNNNEAEMNNKVGAAQDTKHAHTTTNRYVPPPGRHENIIVHQRVHSTDTFSTDCIPIANHEAAQTNKKAAERLNVKPPDHAAQKKQGNTSSYVDILTSPPNKELNAGDRLTMNRQRLEAEVLDPRNAYKKKRNASVPPPIGHAGRALMQSNTAKHRK